MFKPQSGVMMYLVNKTELEYTNKLGLLIPRAASTWLHESSLVDEVCADALEDKWEKHREKQLWQ